MSMGKRIVIVGATSTIAKHCARLWVQEYPVDLTLIGRDAGRLEQIASDLTVRSPQSRFKVIESEFLEPNGIQAAVNKVVSNGPVDIVLIAHGSLPEQAVCQRDIDACEAALLVNGISPVLFAEAFAAHMEKQGYGSLILIGSVAGDRGRKSNYVYGSAKGLVARYAEGMQHRFAQTGIRVTLVKPGPTDTPMTAFLKKEGVSLASPENVAKDIVSAGKKGAAVVYTPIKWKIIMFIIRNLPRMIFHKLNI